MYRRFFRIIFILQQEQQMLHSDYLFFTASDHILILFDHFFISYKRKMIYNVHIL